MTLTLIRTSMVPTSTGAGALSLATASLARYTGYGVLVFSFTVTVWTDRMVLPAALATTSVLWGALAMARPMAVSLVCSSVASSTSKEMPLTVLAPLSAMRLTVLPASLMLRTTTEIVWFMS